MSSPLKLLAILSLLILAACGFSPMYGSGATGSDGLSAAQGLDQIDIALIPDESGVYVRNILIDQFYQNGYPSSPRFSLIVAPIAEQRAFLDVTADSESTRRQISVSTSFQLVDLGSSKTVLQRSASAISSYNVLGSQFTTRVSENDAREAALADLARQIELQVALYLKR